MPDTPESEADFSHYAGSTVSNLNSAPSQRAKIRNYAYSTYTDPNVSNQFCHDKVQTTCENEIADPPACCGNLFSIGENLKYEQAKLFCQQRDMFMSTPTDDTTNQLLVQLISELIDDSSSSIWLGTERKSGTFDHLTYAKWTAAHGDYIANSTGRFDDRNHLRIGFQATRLRNFLELMKSANKRFNSDGLWGLAAPNSQRSVLCIRDTKSLSDVHNCVTQSCKINKRYNWADWTTCSRTGSWQLVVL